MLLPVLLPLPALSGVQVRARGALTPAACITEDNLVELLLDKDGNFREMAYAGYEGIDDAVTYYPVRSPYGCVFSWQGDITRDPLPEGLTLIAK